MLQKGVDNMITGQIIQTSIDELKAITKVDLGVYDLNGSEVASTMEKDDITTDLITGFVASPGASRLCRELLSPQASVSMGRRYLCQPAGHSGHLRWAKRLFEGSL